jgi:rhodanese-related sulfurtransferase
LAGGLRSALGAARCKTLGFSNVGHIEGGFGAWQAAELPVETDEAR